MLKKIIFILILTILAVIIGGFFFIQTANQYQTDGEISIQGLSEKIRIVRDEKNMPYIYAQNRHDLLFGQGFAMAQDRLFQMQLTRMFAEGRISELAGKISRDLDIKHRTIGFARAAQKHVKVLNEAEKADLEAFVAGVNQFIERDENIHLEFSLAGIKPDKWTITTPVTIVYYMGWSSSSNMEVELILQQLYQKLGKEKFTSILPIHTNLDDSTQVFADPVEISQMLQNTTQFTSLAKAEKWLKNTNRQLAWGSNNWATDGSRSTSGKPILAGDPHLDSRILPGTMYACGLFSPAVRAVGVTIPGMHGLLIGRNDYLTNSLTNAYLDVQDLYVMPIDSQNENNYLIGEESYPFETIEETLLIKSTDRFKEEHLTLKATRYGVVVNDLFPEIAKGKALVLRWAALENMQPTLGLSHLLDAKTVEEASEILKNGTMGCNNIVLADTKGNILWKTIGTIPKRMEGTGRMPFVVKDSVDNWLGFVSQDSMPMEQNPLKGWVGNANNNAIQSDYPHYVSNFFAPYYRYARLKSLMESQAKFSVDDHWNYQRDVYNSLAEKLSPIMVNALKENEETKAIAERLNQWNYEENLESVETNLFQNIYRHFAYEVFVDELGEDLGMTYLKNYYVWQERFEKMYLAGNSEWFDDTRTTNKIETLNDMIVRAALKAKAELSQKYGEEMSAWTWGKNHQISFVNPLFREGGAKEYFGQRFPMAGSGETLYRARFAYDNPEEVVFSACLRMVVDLADDEKVRAVLAGGTIGRTFNDGMGDQLEAYMQGASLYWWFSNELIEKNKKSELVLMP